MKQIIPLVHRWPGWWPFAAAAMVVVLIAFSVPGFAAKGGIKGPPTGGESSNNLSAPAIQTDSANSTLANWSVPAEPVLGVHYSYACDQIESDEQFNYPNTSCVDNLSEPGTYYTAEQCTDDIQPSPCQGLDVSRVYWQKVDVNEWWSDDDGILTEDPNYRSAAYVDFGDALEAVSWNERSVVRVEAQPYSSTLPEFDPAVESCAAAASRQGFDPELTCKVGLQMWHVSGQGISEQWGVRATDEDAAVSFNYDSPFQIINTSNARLNLTKMAPGGAECPMPGGNDGDDPPEVGAWLGSKWADTCTFTDEPFSVETSVGGKYVYGYNWRMKNVELDSSCSGWVKTGFWRITFYAPQDVMFDNELAPNIAPPMPAAEARVLPRTAFNTTAAIDAVMVLAAEDEEDPEEDDRLYKPVVDTANNLAYLDICIVGKTKGGGGGKGGGKP